MTGTERFNWCESGQAILGMNLGMVDPAIVSKYIRYKVYMDLIAIGHKRDQAMSLAAERSKCSEITIYRDIRFFQDDEIEEVS